MRTAARILYSAGSLALLAGGYQLGTMPPGTVPVNAVTDVPTPTGTPTQPVTHPSQTPSQHPTGATHTPTPTKSTPVPTPTKHVPVPTPTKSAPVPTPTKTTPPAPKPTPTKTTPPAPTVTHGTGNAIAYRYGTIQLAVTKTNGALTGVSYVQGTASGGRQGYLPTLVQQALAAGGTSFGNISGATYTTQAFKSALASALGNA